MAVSIYAENNKSEIERLVQCLSFNPDNNYLFCSLSGDLNNYLPTLFECIKANPGLDFVVIVFLYESPDFYKCINHLKQLVELTFKKKFAVIDFGSELYHCTHFSYNIFLSEFHKSWIPLSAEQRAYKWFCANRILKPHRIQLIEKIINLRQADSFITAGNFEINQKYKNKITFGLPLNAPDELDINKGNFEATRVVPDSFRQSIFNIVTESSYENIGDTFDTWSRIMITEKSIKAYRLYQFPIFLAPAGHVQLQRRLGFDMFDDIIDHSYDTCLDPCQRINKIADLIEWINQMPIAFWKNLVQKNWERLNNNNHNCNIAKNKLDQDLIIQFEKWTNQ
jgi:hypothetical protein